MSEPAPSNAFLSGGRRPPFFRYVLHLYSSDQVFRGIADFALIGAVVLLFMHPPSGEWFRRTKPDAAPTAKPVQQQPTAQSTPTKPPPPTSASTARNAAPSVPGAQSPVPPPAPAPGGTASGRVPMPAVAEIGHPRLLFRFLVDVDENAFRSSAPRERQQLSKAAQAHRAWRYSQMLDDLAGLRLDDPNVAFMQGVAALHQNDSDRYSRGAERFRVAAGAGQASTLLGVLLVSGPQGVDKDIEAGKRLIEAAAAKGDSMAQRAAGIGYLDGEFGVLNPGRAAGYFKSAVAAGDLPAMMHYAHMLFTGAGVEKDEAAAEDLVERAARAGLTVGQETLGRWILERYKAGVAGDPSDGVYWLERAYQQGFAITALTRLALFYGYEGRGSKWSDRSKSLELFTQAVAFADMQAQYGYATAFHFGYATPKDVVKAYTHYELARQLGSTNAEGRLKTLDDMLSPSEKSGALESARSLRRELKPIPGVVVLQRPDVPQLPSPWPAPSPASTAAAPAP
jgi:TPR repeat protein